MPTNRKILIIAVLAILGLICCIGAACTVSGGSCDSMTNGTSITQTLEKPKPKPKTRKSKKKHDSDCD